MGRFLKWDKKYISWGFTAFAVVACAILFYMALNYAVLVKSFAAKLIRILSPFIWGLIIAYLLTPFMRWSERSIFLPVAKKLNKNSKGRTARGLSVLLSEIFMLTVLTALVYLILPQLYSSLETIVLNSNTYIGNLTQWVTRVLHDYPELESYAAQALGKVNTGLVDWIRSTVLPGVSSVISNVTTGVYQVIKALYNLIIGIIVSVYVLSNLENFAAGGRRLLYSIFSIPTAEKILDQLNFTNRTFMNFLSGKLLDSAIIGLICYICCVILNMPYALLVSVIVGVTNIIPFFGPFIGAIPCAIIILMVSPIKCLIFIVFIFILQQVDGNIIGPKILGNSVGINGFWVMFSIIIGAGLFGFWGMLLGVPVFVVIYTAIDSAVEKKLKKSDLPWEITQYKNMERIDPITHEPVMKDQE